MTMKPPDLEVGHSYHERVDEVTRDLLLQVSELTGEADGKGLSVAFVLALRTVIESGILPAGAIMTGHTVTWHQPPPTGPVKTILTVAEVDSSRSNHYQRVVLDYRTFHQQRTVIEQQQEVLWPLSS